MREKKGREVQREKTMGKIKSDWEKVSVHFQENVLMNITGFVNPSFLFHQWALCFEILIRSSAWSH